MVGEESEKGEDKTMKCQPVPTRSPAAALMSIEKALPPAWRHARRWDGLGLGSLRKTGREGGGTAESEGLSCPRVRRVPSLGAWL